jgi:4'-phosphopantetheinyl transferase
MSAPSSETLACAGADKALQPDWPQLNPGEIHVWQTRLDEAAHEQEKAVLSEDELDRAARYRFRQDSLRFVAGRARLRRILGGYLGLSPEDLIFCRGPQGKPWLFLNPGEAPLYFNVTHADAVALYAVTREGEVGIDIERIREIPDWAGIAGSCFAPRERARLRRLPPDRRMRAFFESWTRQEAFLKASGEGLTGKKPGRSSAQHAGYSLHSFTPAPGYLATLASAFVADRVIFQTWSEAGASIALPAVETQDSTL